MVSSEKCHGERNGVEREVGWSEKYDGVRNREE